MQRVEVVSPVGFGQVPIGIVQIPLPTRRAELGHQAGTNIVIVKVAADAKLGHVDFVGPKDLA